MTAGVVAVLAAAVALRFWASSNLWLDEALTVNIARLPLGRLPQALRHDGAPPLYFVLLHVWMAVFGLGDLAVRALSGVVSVATLPLMWFAGRRLGGRRVAWAATLLLATSPFAVRYATETRMYSLLTLLGVAAYLVVSRALDKPTPSRLALVSATTGALALTHYWALYPLAVAVAVLGVWTVRRCHRSAPPVLAAVLAGGLLFLPWLGIFAYQLRHTGTPWASPAGPTALLSTVAQYSGGSSAAGRALALIVVGLAGLGVLARAVDAHRVELDLFGRPPGRALAVVFAGSLTLAVAVGLVVRTGIEARYTAATFPLLVLLAGLGTVPLRRGWGGQAAMAVAVVLGLVVSAGGAGVSRTQAGEVARTIAQRGRAGDVVIYCPDQLGPAVSRLLGSGFDQATFPAGASPERVDWADYAQAQSRGDVDGFAAGAVARAGAGRSLWLVWAGGYQGLDLRCEQVHEKLARLRPGGRELVVPVGTTRSLEASHLTLYPPAPPNPEPSP